MTAPTASSQALDRQLLLQLGERLKRVRREQGISGTALAEQIGMSRTTLAAIESGDPSPSMGNYLRVMSICGVGAVGERYPASFWHTGEPAQTGRVSRLGHGESGRQP